MLVKLFIPGILFILTLVLGVWVSRAGKPYNSILFNLHKLLALATVVVTVIQVVRGFEIPASPALVIFMLALAALSVIALFASGALLSAGKLDYASMLTIHKIVSVILAVELVAGIYLLESGR